MHVRIDVVMLVYNHVSVVLGGSFMMMYVTECC